MSIALPDGELVSGRPNEGLLEIEVPERITRVEHIDLDYKVVASLAYEERVPNDERCRTREVWQRKRLFRRRVRFPVESGILAAGNHQFPFTLDVPPWIPPDYQGPKCAIEHRICTEIEVGWARNPTATHRLRLQLPPYQGVRTPHVSRAAVQHAGVIEVSLASSTLAEGETLHGHVALRSGHAPQLSGLRLLIVQGAYLPRVGETRFHVGPSVRLDIRELLSGEGVPFAIPIVPFDEWGVRPVFRHPFLSSGHVLRVVPDGPREAQGADFRLLLLPKGSRIFGTEAEAPIGFARVRASAAAMAQATGLAEGRPPILLEGFVGPVYLRMHDLSRSGSVGLDIQFMFPDLDLGTLFEERSIWTRKPTLFGLPLSRRYTLGVERPEHAPPIEPAILTAFFGALAEGFENADLRLSDRHIAAHFAVWDDDGQRMIAAAREAVQKAEQIAAAIRALPFPAPLASSRPTWEAVAREEKAFVVPTSPSMAGLRFGVNTPCAVGARIRTVWDAAGPKMRVELSYRASPPPEAARALEMGRAGDIARGITEVFPRLQIGESSGWLERPAFTPDPRVLFGGIEAFVAWLASVRGERGATGPYR